MERDRWKEIERLYYDALERPAAERAAFVNGVCGNDEVLRSEVESLLASDGPAEHFLKELNDELIAGAINAQATQAVVGRTLGSYQVLSALGGGGMGAVYLAHDTRMNRNVALKLLHRKFTIDPELVERFRQEAHSASSLNHPNIVTVFDSGEADGLHLIATEFIDGQTLQQRIASGPMDVREALDAAVQIARALAAAHEAGIIHRDIKPANVMLRRDGYVKVLDFGIAKLMRAEGERLQTEPGLLIGTPRYMAPEQIVGQPIDGRTDIFSFGVLLFELLSGHTPYESSGGDEILRMLQNPAPALGSVCPGAHPELERIVGKALARDRDSRYQSAADLLHDLTKLKVRLDFEHEPGGDDDVASPDRKESKNTGGINRRWPRMAAGAVGSILMAAAMYWFVQARTGRVAQRSSSSIVVLPFTDLSAEKNQEYLADGLPEELRNWLSRIRQLQVVGTASSRVFKDKAEDFRVIGKRLNVQSILEGSVRRQGSQTRITVRMVRAADGFQLWSGSFDRETNDILAVEEEIARAVAGELKITLEALSEKGASPAAFDAYLQGRQLLRRNQQALESAVSFFEQALQIDRAYPEAWEGLGEARLNQAESGYLPMDDGFQKAASAMQQALKLDPNLAQANWYMGMIKMRHEWDWNGANVYFQRVLAATPGHARGPRGAAKLAAALGRAPEAVELYRRALELDPLNGALSYDLGVMLHYMGNQGDAKDAFLKALAMTPKMEAAHWMLARVYLAQSHPQEALAEIRRETNAAFRLHGLALIEYAMGDKQGSDSNLAELIRAYSSNAPFQIAEVFAFRGDKDQAFEWLDRAYSSRDTGLTEIKNDPLLSTLETDTRYAHLLRKMRLPV